MASENFLARDDFGVTQRVKHFTTSSGNITYTAKTGRAADDFVIDRVIRVTTTADYALTITLPDGVYYGQRCLVILETVGDDETLDVSTTTGDDATQMTAAGGYSDLVWMGSTLGWVELSNETT
jgi:hypothetical protein